MTVRPASTARIAGLGLLGVAVAVAVLYRDALDLERIQAALAGIDPAVAPLLFTLAYAIATVLFLPGSVFGLAGGALFGPLWGTLWNLAGALLGASAAFLVARHGAAEWVARRTGGKLGELVRGIDAEGWRFVAFVRLVPLFPFNLLNYALGLTRIPFSHYLAASAAAMLPGVALYTWIGHAGREAMAGQANVPNLVIAGLALLAVVAFLPRLVRRLRGGTVKWLDAAQLTAVLDAPRPALIVDVRGEEEFGDAGLGRIPGARNIPLAQLPGRIGELSQWKSRPLVLACRTHKRSQMAAELLAKHGFGQVLVLRGGMEAWSRHSRNATDELPAHP